MKRYIYKPGALAALLAGVLLSGCDPEIDAPVPTAGETADFSTYIAVGNSLTAGYQDNGLYREGQVSSYPAILADQFEEVGGGEFTQPLFTEEQADGSGYLRLTGFDAQGSPATAAVTENRAFRSPEGLFTKYLEPVQNLGVPGIRVADIRTPGYGSVQGNPYFERMTPDNQFLQTYLQRVQQSTDHTFFSVWLGNNDVLGYATAGGFTGEITSVSEFSAGYQSMVDALTANGAEGIVATLPDVTGVPFFTTVGPRVKAALKEGGAPAFVAFTGAATNINNQTNRIIVPVDNINDASGGTVLFTLTGSAYASLLGTPTGKYWKDLAKEEAKRETDKDVVEILSELLDRYAVDTTQAFGVSIGNPWPSALLLDDTELAAIQSATTAFNTIIKNQANAADLALWDATAYFNSIQGGFVANGVAYSQAYISGNLFSLDGVHPTPRGYAIIANEMIKAINAKYGGNIQTVDETQYRAVLFP